MRGGGRPVSLGVDGVLFLVSFVCAYVIGTFPVKDTLPGPDVASGKEVSYDEVKEELLSDSRSASLLSSNHARGQRNSVGVEHLLICGTHFSCCGLS